MKKVGSYVKNNLLGFIVGGLIFGITTVIADTIINSTHGAYKSTTVKAALDELYNVADFKDEVKDMLYPVGSIYISVSNKNPSNIFGGTWVSFGEGRTLVGIDSSDNDFKTVEKTGGSKAKTIAVENLPAHTHGVNINTNSTGAHTHGVSAFNTGNQSANHTHSVGAINTGNQSANHTHGVGAINTGGNSRGHTHSGNTSEAGYHNHGVGEHIVQAWAQLRLYGEGITEYGWVAANTGGMASTYGGGSHAHSFTTGGESQNHTHTVPAHNTGANSANHYHTVPAHNTGGQSANHYHSVPAHNTGSAGGHTHNVNGNTGSTGSGTALNTQDPYITVYMWKRTA